MNQTQREYFEHELNHARRMQSHYFCIMIAFAVSMIFSIFLLSSFNSENIAAINRLSSENQKLTIERDALEKVQCVDESTEDDEEITLENAHL